LAQDSLLQPIIKDRCCPRPTLTRLCTPSYTPATPLCRLQADVRLLVDAEHSYFQPAIDNTVTELQRTHNRQAPRIYNTVQVGGWVWGAGCVGRAWGVKGGKNGTRAGAVRGIRFY
jgi:hypothetical protein